MHKTDFENKLRSFNRRFTFNKKKPFRSLKETTKDYIFFLGRICFIINDESQFTFVYERTLDTFKFKKDKAQDCAFLVGDRRKYLTINLSQYILLS